MSKHLETTIRVPVNMNNPALKRIESLCIQCGKCRDVCEQDISVGNHFDLNKTLDQAICVHCGQCINVCPTGALVEIKSYAKVKEAILDPHKKVVVMTSPSVRAALGEEFGMDAGSYVEEEMVGALRSLGVDYVFDTTFAADLTIMEEA
ncbi:MAG: [Fe-Fe] hydrogenase large subunit C-terminal domain-containing protein, partial [Erysipelotrichaceae bacterium]